MSEVVPLPQQRRATLIVDDEAHAKALVALGIAASTYTRDKSKDEKFGGADLVLVPRNDDRGYLAIEKIGAALSGVAARIRVLRLPDLPPSGSVGDWLAAGGTREQLEALIEAAPEWVRLDDPASKALAEAGERQLIDELTRLSDLEYDRRRREAAQELGVRGPALDREVRARRAELERSEPPPLVPHWRVDSWPDPVDGLELVSALKTRIQRFVVLGDEQALVVALWILFSWVHEDVATYSSILLITSPEQESGKTTLGDLLTLLVRKGISGVAISPAFVFRAIDAEKPTIAADEGDSRYKSNDELREVMNSGWTRGSGVMRYDVKQRRPRVFPTFAPKIIVAKGLEIPTTTLSRSIIIRMKKRKASEPVERFRHIDDAESSTLRRQCLRWASQNAASLEGASPPMPLGFDNRLAANFETIFAIADFIGGELPEQARTAAAKLSVVTDTVSDGVRALTHIKELFDESVLSCLASAVIVQQMKSMADGYWSEWRSPKTRSPLSPGTLARLLAPFGITSQTVWPTRFRSARGYMRATFEDAWERYLPPPRVKPKN